MQTQFRPCIYQGLIGNAGQCSSSERCKQSASERLTAVNAAAKASGLGIHLLVISVRKQERENVYGMFGDRVTMNTISFLLDIRAFSINGKIKTITWPLYKMDVLAEECLFAFLCQVLCSVQGWKSPAGVLVV